MSQRLNRKLRNWGIIFASMAIVILIIKLGGVVAGIETNPSGFAILVGGGIWYELEGKAKFAQIRKKYRKKQND